MSLNPNAEEQIEVSIKDTLKNILSDDDLDKIRNTNEPGTVKISLTELKKDNEHLYIVLKHDDPVKWTDKIRQYLTIIRSDALLEEHAEEEGQVLNDVYDGPVHDITPEYVEAPEDMNMAIGGYLAERARQLVRIEGICRVVSDVHVIDLEREYRCRHCARHQTIAANQYLEIGEPTKCQACGKQGPWKYIDSPDRADHQALKVNEDMADSTTNKPTTMHVEALGKEKIPDNIREGDRIEVIGMLQTKPEEDTGHTEHWIDAITVNPVEKQIDSDEISSEDIERIEEIVEGNDTWEVLKNSFAPNLIGIDEDKEAVIAQLFADKVLDNFNVLLLGDPGAGKTKMMAEARELATKSMKTVGPSSSGVGLTASIDYINVGGKERPYIAPGALTLADGGTVSIDEFDKMDDEVFAQLLEALESREVSISKHGLSSTLPARSNVLAGANPKYGRFDDMQPIAEQIGFDPYVISRFDLVRVMRATPDKERDTAIMNSMMDTMSGVEAAADGHSENMINYDMLRKWIAYAQANYDPVIKPGSEARQVITDYYNFIVNELDVGDDQDVPLDLRDARAIIRLARIIARINLSDVVTVEHAEKATDMIQSSLNSLGMDTVAMANSEFDASQVECASTVRDIIKQNDDGIAREDVLELAKEQNIMVSDAKHRLTKMEKQGDVFEKDGLLFPAFPN